MSSKVRFRLQAPEELAKATDYSWPPDKVLPVSLVIHDQEILGDRENPFVDLPVARLARWGIAALEAARERGRYSYYLEDFPGAILMEMVGDDFIAIHCTLEENTGIVEYGELYDAWLTFEETIRQGIRMAFPSAQHRTEYGWGAWLRGHLNEQPQEINDDWHVHNAKFITDAVGAWRQSDRP